MIENEMRNPKMGRKTHERLANVKARMVVVFTMGNISRDDSKWTRLSY
jgi:hypothetical protein